MKSFLYQFGIELRLYYRNRMALLYGYLFPTIFLVAFWVLYRHERIPLINHMGELLTVTALGGACFGLPTAMVSERERGVWRRYRIAPVSTLQLVLGTIAARYIILITAALLQLALAMLIGMPLPDHLVDLWAAFTFVSFAFLGLGLVIAMLADNVPAVQALGQSVFLPMLIIGGVAVRIESLPAWAQHLSAFFPGRYSVEAVQATVTGGGLSAAPFAILALTLVGAAGCLAAAKLFRWDARERFVSRGGKAWLGVALAAWVAVGLLAEATGRIAPQARTFAETRTSRVLGDAEAPPDFDGAAGAVVDTSGADGDERADTAGREAGAGVADEERASADGAEADDASADEARETADSDDAPAGRDEPVEDRAPGDPAANGADRTADQAARQEDAGETQDDAHQEGGGEEVDYPSSWQEVTLLHVERDVRFDALPYDEGLEAPVAGMDDPVYPDIERTMDCVFDSLGDWPPARVDDPVQRVRNVLYVAAVPDIYQMSGIENWVPHAVFDFLRQTTPEDRLVKVLYWIATRPEEGTIEAASRLDEVCLDVGGPDDEETLRQRTGWYAAKLLGRVTGHIRPR